MDAIQYVKELLKRESGYDRKHRIKQIEATRNFASTLEHLHDRLPQSDSVENKTGDELMTV